MSKRSDTALVLSAVLILVIVLGGEVVTYTSDFTSYNADVRYTDDGIEYSVSADGSKTYSVIMSENGSYKGIDGLYIYYDETYRSDYEDVLVPVGARELNQEYYVEQLTPTLRYRGIQDITVVDAEELKTALESDSADGTATKGLVVISGALPDTVYKGNADDLVFKWMSCGDSLYWLGNLIGANYATQDALVPVDGYQQLFFGSECLNTGDTVKAYGEIDGYCSALCLTNNCVKYSVDGSRLPAGTNHTEIGFTEDGYSSVSLVGFGKGMVCILGGDYSNNQRNDLAQVIASGIGPESSIVASESGTVTRGTVDGTMQAEGENLVTFVFMGGYYPVFCKLFKAVSA